MTGFSDSVHGKETGDHSRKRARTAHLSFLGASLKAAVQEVPGVHRGALWIPVGWSEPLWFPQVMSSFLPLSQSATQTSQMPGERQDALITL